VKQWFSHAATLVFVGLALTGCGGGGASDAGPIQSAGLVAMPVDVPAVVTQVEPYQRPAASASASLKREIVPSVGSRPAPAVVRLPRLDAAKAAPGTPRAGRPMQIGSAREIAQSSDPQRMRGLLQFKPGAAGEGPTAAVSFTSPGAAALRLGLRVRDLPAAARVSGYTQGGATAFELSGADIVAAIQRNRDAGDVSDHGRTFWTPVVESEEATLEIALPVGASPDTVKVSVPMLSHVTVKARELDTLMLGTAASCEIDVSCAADAATQSRATARMIFVDGGFSYACTGTLLNDAQSSGNPYFLSAEHCISTQTAASSLITYWFYRSASCNAQTLDPTVTQLSGGATLLYSSTNTDTSFMRLNAIPPANAVFAGWSASPPQFGQELIAVHHPRGGLQKISRGSLAGFLDCTVGLTESFNCRQAPISSSTYLAAEWSLGTVESGSSGSGLFTSINGSRYLVGQLKGGSASCQDPSGLNAYGRFDLAYNAALNRWLSPGQTSGLTMQAVSPNIPRVPVHRFYNFATGAHFYTPIAAERDYVLANFPSYAYEGLAFYAYDTQVTGSYPVYRLYNRNNRRHFYTMAKNERDSVLASLPEVTDEGIAWYAQWGSSSTASPMYRFYNPVKGSHFYTLSEAEKAIVLRDQPTFILEGVAYYAWATQ
jgi:lysyl endopeptidase